MYDGYHFHQLTAEYLSYIYKAVVRDIEDLVTIGKRLGTCPYYGTRKSIRQAQVDTLFFISFRRYANANANANVFLLASNATIYAPSAKGVTGIAWNISQGQHRRHR